MKGIKALSLLLFFVMLASVQAGGKSKKKKPCGKKGKPTFIDKKKKAKKKSKTSFMRMKTKDMECWFKGRIREDYFYYDGPLTLRHDLDDEYAYFRNRLELQWYLQQGKKKYGKPSSEAGVKVSHYGLWQVDSNYVKLSPEETTLSSLDGAVTGNSHTHNNILPLMYMEDAWFKINFDAFVKCFKKHPVSLKAGYFMYWVGRGLSLGAHDDMALTYGGWGGESGFFRFPTMPPGILLRIGLTKHLTWDLYYNKWREFSDGPEMVWQNTAYKHHLYGPGPNRGRHKDRDTWMTKFKYKNSSKKFGKFYVEPYFIYTNSPEQKVEVAADAKAKLGTVGLVWDHTYKGFNINMEGAVQFGHQHMLGIDRNEIELSRSKTLGQVQERFSHVFFEAPVTSGLRTAFPKGTFPDKVPVRRTTKNTDLLELVNKSFNRGVTRNNKPIVESEGGPEVKVVDPKDNAEKRIFNSDFFGNPRFRKPQKLDYQGLMGIVDMGYTFKKAPLKLGAAAGYIGGDSYPYNGNEKGELSDRSYKTFIAQRGFYLPKHVYPVLMFERLVIGRPLNIRYKNLVARNNFRDYSNIQYLGASLTWYPLKNRRKMKVNPNVICYWEVGSVYKWDKDPATGKHPDAAIELQINEGRKELGFTGWTSKDKASKFLGTELNLAFDYFMLPTARVYFRGYAFFAGQIYKDLDGQPNEFGLRFLKAGEEKKIKAYGQGHSTMIGFYTGIDYKF